MKIIKDIRGSGAVILLIVLVLAVIGAVGYITYTKSRGTKNNSAEQASTTISEPRVNKSDSEHVNELITKAACGAGEGTPSVDAITFYQQFAVANANCRVDADGGPGALHILKKTGDTWEQIARSQDSCLNPDLKTKHGMTDEIKDKLFPGRTDVEFCAS